MATMVLTVAGGLIGGPLGASVGALIGNTIDRQVLFRPKGREGARLSDLRVQTSAYGTPLPRLFGTMRVAGCVIWATDLIEHRSTQGGGKGQPSTTSYSYSASFAVALSSRPILGVGRIWADGKLLRGAAGDFKTRTGYRLYRGSEDQAPDPLIASIEGAATTPAHRGCAYAVFEGMELADYGNRIPQLTFEVTADAAPVAIEAIVGDLAPELAGGEALGVVGGFSASGESVQGAIEGLRQAAGAWLTSDGAGQRLMCGGGSTVTLADVGAEAEGRGGARAARAIAAEDATPRAVCIGHYDPARDYQAGLQRAARAGAGGRETRIELAVAIDAASARTMARNALARASAERETRTVRLGWDAMTVRPGERIAIAGVPGSWRVERWAFERMAIRLDCVRIAAAALPGPASGGRSLAADDRVQGRTVATIFELPAIDTAPASAPQLVAAAAGTGAAWRSAALLYSIDGGASWRDGGRTAYPAVIGQVVVPPGPARAALIDRINRIEITVANDEMMLTNADSAAIDAGANLAMVGDELLQFGRAEPLGAGRWRLSKLWRGRRGTEYAIATQVPGDRFVLVTRDTLKPLDIAAPIGASISLIAQGPGDDEAAPAIVATLSGVSVVPPSPVALSAVTTGDATIVRWVRRSRLGWAWQDGLDAPLGEEAERYSIEIASPAATRTLVTDAPQLTIPNADRALPLSIRVRQIGTLGLSQPAQLSLPSLGETA
ncbi:GTA baseplate fiber-binding domain-containing protein [Sphingomonas sp. RS6]